MKKTKIIIPALGMLLLSTAASVSGTVAWFSLNSSVQITGMSVKTKVQSGILISNDTTANLNKNAENTFSGNPLLQGVSKILEPVSTNDALSFFYSIDANADGSKHNPITGQGAAAFTAYNSSDAATGDDAASYLDKFSQTYGVTKTMANTLITGEQGAYAYADYAFQLKVSNYDAAVKYINLTQLDLTYGAATDGSKAYRIAIFAQQIGENDTTFAALAAAQRKGTWKKSDAGNFTNEFGTEQSSDVAQAVVSGTTTYAKAQYVSAKTPIAEVPASGTYYYKVVARMWLEGQDTTCNNDTFAALDSDWSLAMSLKLDTASDAADVVTAINYQVTNA